jgi:hypothetical protein
MRLKEEACSLLTRRPVPARVIIKGTQGCLLAGRNLLPVYFLSEPAGRGTSKTRQSEITINSKIKQEVFFNSYQRPDDQ